MEETKTNFWNTYAYTISFLLCTILIVSSAFIPALAYVAMVVFIASACYFDANKTLGLLFLFLLTEIILSSVVYTGFAFASAFAIILYKAIKAKRVKWENSLIFPIVCIVIIFIMSFVVYNDNAPLSIAPIRYPLIFISLLLVHMLRKEFNILELYRYLYCALFITCLFGIIFIFPNPSGIQSFHSDEFGYFRYRALTGHENTLYAYPVVLIGLGIYFYFKEKITIYEFCSISLVCLFIGYITCSKAFLLLSIIAILLFFICSLKKGPTYILFETLIFLCFVAVGYLTLKDQIIRMFDRFFLYFSGGNILNTLTTGRYDIWAEYYAMWKQNTVTILFGIGANYIQLGDLSNPMNYVHCAYLDILVKFGLIGTLIIFAFLGYLIYKLPKHNLRFINFIPLILVMINMIDEEFMSTKIIVLLIAIICLFDTSIQTAKIPKQYKKDNKTNKQFKFFTHNNKT